MVERTNVTLSTVRPMLTAVRKGRLTLTAVSNIFLSLRVHEDSFSGHELPARFHRFHARVEKDSFSTRRTETGLYEPIGIKSNVRTLNHKPRSISNLGLRPRYEKHLGFMVSVRNYYYPPGAR